MSDVPPASPRFPTEPPQPPEPADTTDGDDVDHPGTADDGTGEDGTDGRRWFQPPSLVQAIAMVLALLFLGGAIGWTLETRSDDPNPSDIDIGFLQDMITHHEQALQMAFPVIRNGENAIVRDHAQEVLLFQTREIGIMHTLLTQWGIDLSIRPDEAMVWMGMPMAVEQMLGLATDEQMAELREATGTDADELFLELLIRHHLGGLHMAEYAAEYASEKATRDLAAQIAEVQTLEVQELTRLQRDLGFDVTQ
jgi:uncharacterized protein (DUF305 family)